MVEKQVNDEPEKNNLRFLRELLGMTQQELAEFLGVAVSTISRCERGLSELELPFAKWQKLAALVRQRLKVDVIDAPPFELSGSRVASLRDVFR